MIKNGAIKSMYFQVLSPPCIGLVFVTNLVSIKLIMVYGEYGECNFR